MKLALLHHGFKRFGGAELLAISQARYFKARGLDVSIATFRWDEVRLRALLGDVPVRLLPDRTLSRFFMWKGALDRQARDASRLLADADVVLGYNAPCNVILGAAGWRPRRFWQCNEPPRGLHPTDANPYLAARVAQGGPFASDAERAFARSRHRNDKVMFWRQSVRERRARWDVERSSQLSVIAISEFTRDNVRRIYGASTARVIYPMVNFPRAGRGRSGLDRRGLRILVQSRLELGKNIDTVLRGFALFAASSSGAELHIVGEGPQRSRLAQLATQLRVAERVRFYGFLAEERLSEIYDHCDVFALLPLDEPFGMVFPEAAARGLLLVGPDHGGPLEILDGGRLGAVCDALSPEQLADRLRGIEAMSDADIDRRRSAADRACRSRYAVDVIGPQLIAALGERG